MQPENVLVDDTDTPHMKISSFALAQFVAPGNVLVKVCGNWAYAAPEMYDQSRPGYNCRFDVFSLGVVLCKCSKSICTPAPPPTVFTAYWQMWHSAGRTPFSTQHLTSMNAKPEHAPLCLTLKSLCGRA